MSNPDVCLFLDMDVIPNRVGMDGVRTFRLNVDVMLNDGRTYYGTFHPAVVADYDLSMGMYYISYSRLCEYVLERYPSLEGRSFRAELTADNRR